MYQAFESNSSPGAASDEHSPGPRLEEDPDTLKKYKALQKSVCFLCLLSLRSNSQAVGSKSFGSGDYIEVIHEGRLVRVRREIDLDRVLEEKLPVASKHCPPACIGPVQEDLEVGIFDELHILKFMECELALGSGALVDARTHDVHAKGTIPGSVNVPYTVFHLDADAPELVQALCMLGAKPKEGEDVALCGSENIPLAARPSSNGVWDFSKAKDIVLWCHGPMGQQSIRAINGLRKLGYPREKINHYRGGMQLWQVFDLTTVAPD